MAEISYPFATDSAGGGTSNVSQIEWQNMAHLWGADRIDFQLRNNSYAVAELPFYAAIEGNNLTVQPGAAWVGGVYYKLDAPWTGALPTNTGSQPRIDVLVIRLNMVTGSANLAIRAGQPAANPVEPNVARNPGANWELPLYAIELGANSGARSLSDRRRFDGPGRVWTPWNTQAISDSLPRGHFLMDMDVNQNDNDTQGEFFKGRDGYMITRHLGKRRPYTPALLGGTPALAAGYREGFYRYIAPGTIQFSIQIRNTSTRAINTTSGASALGFTLPVSASKTMPQVLTGFLTNSESRDSYPNLIDVVCKVNAASNNVYMHLQSPTSLASGLDGLKKIPGKSDLIVSGVYETSAFD